MVQQSWPKVWVKKERLPKKHNSSNAPKANKLAEQIAAGVARGEDKYKYSRDFILKNFTPEKADLTAATVSTPTTTASDSKGSSLMGSPELALPSPLVLSEALGGWEPKDCAAGFPDAYAISPETASPDTEQNYIWFGEMTQNMTYWNDTCGNEVMSQFPVIPDFPISEVPASLPIEQPTEKKSKRKPGKSGAAEAASKAVSNAGARVDTKESTKAGKKAEAKANVKANTQEGKAGKKGGGKAGAKSGKAADLSAIAELVAQDIAMPVTTLMLRNIPNECTRNQLFEHLEKAGFQGMIDFIYLPINFSTDRNFGYSFLNFRTAETASAFMETFNGVPISKCLPIFKGDKACKVVPAAIQGWEANMRKLCGSNSALRALGPEHWHPLFLDAAGQKVDITGGYKNQKVAKKSLNPEASEFVPDGLNPNASEYVPECLNTEMSEYVSNNFYSAANDFAQADFSGNFAENNIEMDDEWLQHLARIQVQVEYYFSAANLDKDFYLKSVMDQDGWVETSVLAQFNRMKQMNADAPTIAQAVSVSLFVELSPDGQRMRSAYPSDVMTAPDSSPS
mmetsp:Transcript_140521/g.262073  ORF Transcript_140521/g.262073 Transcript_140521/m.262073 type:complete len:567 (+) Transcript_140521:127-1827(+)